MAPKAVQAAIVSPTGGGDSDESVSPPGPGSVQRRQESFEQAIEEASTEDQQLKEASEDAFPYGITVPFKVRDVVPGNKCASAKVFLGEAPIQALKDMCFYLQLDERGSSTDLVTRIVDYFIQMYPDSKAASGFSQSTVYEKLASGPTPARAGARTSAAKVLNADSSAPDLKARLAELGKPVYGSRETLWKRLQEAEAEHPEAQPPKKKRASVAAPEEDKSSLKKQKTSPTDNLQNQKSTENLQNQYCVPGLSIKAQMEMAMKLSMEG